MSLEEYKFVELSEVQRNFAEYCLKTIDNAVKEGETTAEIRFADSPAICQLTYREINQVYTLLSAYWFNERNITVFFGGYDLGSVVSIYYLNKRDFENPNYKTNVEYLLKYCRCQAKEKPKEIINLDMPRMEIMVGYWYNYMYHEVKEQLLQDGIRLYYHPKVGWQLKPVINPTVL